MTDTELLLDRSQNLKQATEAAVHSVLPYIHIIQWATIHHSNRNHYLHLPGH